MYITLVRGYSIPLAIPIISCFAERSFSTLKHVLTRSRSSMLQVRLKGLRLMAIERKNLMRLDCLAWKKFQEVIKGSFITNYKQIIYSDSTCKKETALLWNYLLLLFECFKNQNLNRNGDLTMPFIHQWLQWLYVLIMSCTLFRVNPQSIVAWMLKNSMQALYLKFKWLQRDSNPQLLSS